jgi:NAD(P)-dependent dehydrogenase (short-subunit alcohol dehydrogenase family)
MIGMGQFTEKTVFITGAAKGQGRAVALAFAREGANIVGFDLGRKISYPAYNNSSSDDLEILKKDIEALGSKAFIYTGDVRIAKDVENAVAGGVEAFGTIDVLFNNAGICAYGLAHELTEAEWDSMIDINLKGSWLAAKYVIPHLIAQKSGVIINNSSIAGLRGMNRLSHYAASKWALVGLTKSLALELAPHNITVNAIGPGSIHTDFNDDVLSDPEFFKSCVKGIPAGRIGHPEDISGAVVYLASDEASFVNGALLIIEGAMIVK